MTTDIIVGFPGETEEEFEESRAFVEKVNFYETHIFKYSKRQGTKAAVMPNQVPEPEKTKRSNTLLALDERNRKAYEEQFSGKETEILVEEQMEKDGKTYWIGHTKEYIRLAILSDENLSGRLLKVTVGKECMDSGCIVKVENFILRIILKILHKIFIVFLVHLY